MISVSHYSRQAHNLPIQNDVQMTYLQATDIATRIREACKILTAIGVISMIANLAFGTPSSKILAGTVICSAVWFISSEIADRLIPYANMIIGTATQIQGEYDNLLSITGQLRGQHELEQQTL